MATINDLGNIQARCPGCNGALSTFNWRGGGREFGSFNETFAEAHGRIVAMKTYRLFQCAGCDRGAIAEVIYQGVQYPGSQPMMMTFFPEVKERLSLPPDVPEGIQKEFREGEQCLEANCIRAAAGMFRSVLDKTLRANGYKENNNTSLKAMIDAAAANGVITAARQKRAHDEIRVLGNDVLHDEWQDILVEDVEAARHYSQRILEDLYDDRPSVLDLLRVAGRVLDEDRPQAVTT